MAANVSIGPSVRHELRLPDPPAAACLCKCACAAGRPTCASCLRGHYNNQVSAIRFLETLTSQLISPIAPPQCKAHACPGAEELDEPDANAATDGGSGIQLRSSASKSGSPQATVVPKAVFQVTGQVSECSGFMMRVCPSQTIAYSNGKCNEEAAFPTDVAAESRNIGTVAATTHAPISLSRHISEQIRELSVEYRDRLVEF
jgi:hypothetical protein